MKYAAWLIFPIWIFLLSCASITTPQGGPKDSIPPSLIKSTPRPNQTNFNGTNIELQFDELLVLNNPKEEIIIVPSIGKKSKFVLKTDKVVIEPELPWKENTTYNINLRESVKDITEGNITRDQHLAFSTGPEIDTLTISGKIKEALKLTIPENITVALYTSDTFNIFEHTPEYFTKANKSGDFIITNLKADKYRIYAFDDKNKNLKVESRTEKFGFLSDKIQLDTSVANLTIPLVNIDTRKPKLNSRRTQAELNTIRFNKSLDRYQLISKQKILSHYSNNQSEIIAYYPDIETDSIPIGIIAHDSTDQKIDTTIYIKRERRAKIEESFKVSATDATFNLETNRLQFTITTNKPLRLINPDSLYIPYDTLFNIQVKTPSLSIDTIRNKITVDQTFQVDSLPKLTKLVLGKGYLISIDSDSSKKTPTTLKLIDAPTTATLLLNIQTKEPNFIIEVLDNYNKVLLTERNKKKLELKYLPPEALKIRAIVDKNGNGRWDTANAITNTEPEPIIYYYNAEKKTDVPLRANWEVGPLIFKF